MDKSVCVCGLTGQIHSMRAALLPPLLKVDWQLSCLAHCRGIFVRSHSSDRGSEGLLSQEMAYCFSALQGCTHSRALPVISLYRWDYVSINLCLVISKSNIPWVFIIIIIIRCTLLYQLIVLYYCKSSVAWTHMDLQ